MFFCFLFFQNLLFSQETIVITANRVKEHYQEKTGSVEYISGLAIEQSGPLTLSDLLKRETGLSFSQKSIYLRGADPSSTLVIMDDVILNDPTTPTKQFDPSKIILSNIERIEILKGSQSVLYGSNALGGVIIIHSKKNLPQSSFSIENGSYQHRKVNASTAIKNSQATHLFSIGYQEFLGPSAADDQVGKAGPDGFHKSNFKYNYNRDNFSGSLNLYLDKEDLDKGGGNNSDDPNYQSKNFTGTVALQKSSILRPDLIHKLIFNHSQYHRKFTDGPDAKFTSVENSSYNGTATLLSSHQSFQYNDSVNFFHQLQFNNDRHISKSLNIFSTSLYTKQNIYSLNLNYGIRYDFNQYFKNAITYKFALSRLFTNINLRSSYSNGIKNPTLYQLFDSRYGNKSLSPEKSKHIELGIDFFTSKLMIENSFYYTLYQNRHSFHSQTYQNINQGKAYVVGLENSAIFTIGSIKNSLKQTLLKTYNYSTGKQFSRRPKYKVSDNLSLTMNKYTFDLTQQFTSNSQDTNNQGSYVVNRGHFMTNLRVLYDLKKDFQISLAIDNLTNKKYQEAYGYNTLGRAFYLGGKFDY